MNEIKVKVNFKERTLIPIGVPLTSGDYNSTKLVFDFDISTGIKVFELKNPNNELVLCSTITNNELILVGQADIKTVHNEVEYIKYLNNSQNVFWYDPISDKLFDFEWNEVVDFNLNNYIKPTQNCSLFNVDGDYIFEISLYEGSSKLTSLNGFLPVEKEQVIIGDEETIKYIPLFDQLMSEVIESLYDMDDALQEVDNLDIDVSKSDDTATITITKKDGTSKSESIADGKDAKINGYNTINVEAGTNIEIVQNGSTMTINNTYDDSSILSDINDLQTNKANISDMNTAISNAVGTETTNRQNADNNLQGQIDAITSSSDVVDIVGTYGDLENYDTTKLTEDDVIKVLTDSTHSNASTYYRWSSNAWDYIGSEGPFYTKSETNTLLNEKYEKPNTGIPKTDLSSDVQTSLGKADTAVQDVSGKEDKTNKVTTMSNSSTDTQYPSAKCVYDSQITQDEIIENIDNRVEYYAKYSNALTKVTDNDTDITLNNAVEAPMNIELNSTALEQESDPSPLSPQDIHTISGDNEIKIQNKNLCNISDGSGAITDWLYQHTPTYVQITKDMVGKKISISYDLNIKSVTTSAQQVVGVAILGPRPIDATVQIKTSPVFAPTIGIHNIKMEDIEIQQSYVDLYLSIRPISFGVRSDCAYDYSKVLVEYGEISTSFVKHKGQTYPINLGNIEYAKIPNTDYKDSFVYQNNKWYKRAKVKKVVLDGSETGWSTIGMANAKAYQLPINTIKPNINNSSLTGYLTSHFKEYTPDQLWQLEDDNGFAILYPNPYIRVTVGDTTDKLDEFKTWLSTHNVTLWFALTTPEDIEITDTTLSNQLTAIYNWALSYDGQTNISQTNDDLPFEINISAVIHVPTKVSELTNDSGYITDSALTNVAYKNANNNFSTDQTINGNLQVNGDITNTGSSYETHAEKIYTKNDYIITRDGAVSGLASGDYSGFQAKKYDGTNDGRLVFDNTGTARVGDVGDEVPLLARDESTNMTDGKILTWDGTNLIAKTVIGVWEGTEAAYQALVSGGTVDSNTYYCTKEE